MSASRARDLDRFKAIVEARAFRQGESFTLASGRVSQVYFNMKPAMMDPQGADLIGRLVAEAAGRLGVSHVGGLEMGAVPPIAQAVAASARMERPLRGVFVRKAAKGHGTRARIEGLCEDEGLEGRSLALVEDVTTTGGSAMEAIAALREAGALIEHVITLLDREEGAGEAFADEGLILHPLLRKSDFTALV